jgi:hypothetical protein
MIRPLLLLVACAAITAPTEAATFFGVTTDNNLVSFDTSAPSTFLTSTAITGLKASDGTTDDASAVLLNLTYHAGTNTHYGIDSNSNFYSVTRGGVATLVSSTFSTLGFAAGFAYDPISDKMLFASDVAENVLFSTNGTRTTNGALVYGAGDTNVGTAPVIFALGIDPDFGSSYFLDSNLNTLVTSVDPNFSELFTVGGLGLDVVSFGGLAVDESGNIWGSLSTDGLSSSLYSINGLTGAATAVGSFGSGVGIHSMAAIPEPSRALLFGMSLVCLTFRRRRSA